MIIMPLLWPMLVLILDVCRRGKGRGEKEGEGEGEGEGTLLLFFLFFFLMPEIASGRYREALGYGVDAYSMLDNRMGKHNEFVISSSPPSFSFSFFSSSFLFFSSYSFQLSNRFTQGVYKNLLKLYYIVRAPPLPSPPSPLLPLLPLLPLPPYLPFPSPSLLVKTRKGIRSSPRGLEEGRRPPRADGFVFGGCRSSWGCEEDSK